MLLGPGQASSPELVASLDPEAWMQPEQVQQAREWLFELSCQLAMQLSQLGQEQSLVLIHFMGVLGIHSYSLAYKTAYTFTPTIAGLIWICRLLILEYMLPYKAYKKLGWPAREAYENPLARLQEVRQKYMCNSGFYPLACLLEALIHSRRFACKEGCRTNLSWSVDKKVLTLYDQSFSIASFQHMVRLAL